MLLLSSMSRGFLRFVCRGLRGIYAGYASSATLIGDARIYYTEICQALDSSPVRVDVYEKLLAGVDSAVRHAYHGAGFGDIERPVPEKELLVNGQIPPVLVAAVATLLRQTVPTLKPEIDRMSIYLGDYSWLGFGSDDRTQMYKRRRDVDILNKTPLLTVLPAGDNAGSGKQGYARRRRRCARCGEVSGDMHPPRSLLSFRMIAKLGLLRSCVCGGMWTLESGSGQGSAPSVSQGQRPTRTPG